MTADTPDLTPDLNQIPASINEPPGSDPVLPAEVPPVEPPPVEPPPEEPGTDPDELEDEIEQAVEEGDAHRVRSHGGHTHGKKRK